MSVYRAGSGIWMIEPEPVRLRAPAAAAEWWLPAGVDAGDCVAAYQPIGAASLAASYVNLANPGTHDAAPGVAPTFAAETGWTFNGSTQYLTMGITIPDPPSPLWSVSARVSDMSSSDDRGIIGSYNFAERYFGLIYQDGPRVAFCNGGVVNIVGLFEAGVLGIGGDKAYIDGVQQAGTISNTWSGYGNPALLLGCWGFSGGDGRRFYFNAKIQAVAIYSAVLSDAQMAALHGAMAAL